MYITSWSPQNQRAMMACPPPTPTPSQTTTPSRPGAPRTSTLYNYLPPLNRHFQQEPKLWDGLVLPMNHFSKRCGHQELQIPPFHNKRRRNYYSIAGCPKDHHSIMAWSPKEPSDYYGLVPKQLPLNRVGQWASQLYTNVLSIIVRIQQKRGPPSRCLDHYLVAWTIHWLLGPFNSWLGESVVTLP